MAQTQEGLRPATWEDTITAIAKAHGINPSLALAVAKRESGLNPEAVGDTDLEGGPSVGLFQLRPATAEKYGVDPADPLQNITGGVKFLKELSDRFRDPSTGLTDIQKVLMGYNGGPEHVDAGDVSPAAQAYAAEVWADMSAALRKGSTVTPPTETTPSITPAVSHGPEQTSPFSRFVGETVQSAIVEPISGLATLAKGAVTDPLGTAKAVGRGLIEPTVRHLEKATVARQAGKPLEWTSEMLRAIPIIGPLGEQIGEQFQSGDVAGALGRTVGTAATYLIPKAFGKISPSKAVGPVPLLRSQRTGSGLSQFVEHIGERTIPGKGLFRQFREVQQQALQAEGERLASTLAQVRGSTDTGRVIKQAINQSLTTRKASATALYGQIDNLVQGAGIQPETQLLKQAAMPLLARIRAEANLLPPQELARTTAILDRIMSSPDRLPFSVFQDARSDLLRIVRSVGDPVPGKAGGVAKLLSKEADAAMMNAAVQSGVPGLPQMIRDANLAWADIKTVYNAPFIKKVLNESPEAIPHLMKLADVDELALLKKATPPAVYQAGSARILRDLITDATTQPPTFTPPTWMGRFGLTPQGVPTAHGPNLQGHKLSEAIQKMGPDKADALFGPNAVSGIEDLAVLADRVRPQQVDRVAGGLVAAGINASILAPLLGPILRPTGILSPGALVVSGVYAATATIAINRLSYVLTRPQGLTTYRAFLRATGQGNLPLATLLGTRLAAQLGESEAMQPVPSHETPP